MALAFMTALFFGIWFVSGWMLRKLGQVPSTVGGFLIGAISTGFILSENIVDHENELSALQAITICREAIRNTAFVPENADIPYVENFGDKEEFYFAWGHETKFAKMKNNGPGGAGLCVLHH